MQDSYIKFPFAKTDQVLILRKFQKKLGLTNAEANDIFINIKSKYDCDFNRIDLVKILDTYRTNMKHLPNLTPTTLTEARLMLNLRRAEMAAMLGHAQTEHVAKHLYRMETGMITIAAPRERLVRAYLTGYRPLDWPLGEN